MLRLGSFACMPSPLPRQADRPDGVCSLIPAPSASAFPEIQAGRLLYRLFRGLLSVHSRYGLHARRVAIATLYIEGSGGFVTSAAASIATGWSEQFPGGTCTRCGPAPFHGAPNNSGWGASLGSVYPSGESIFHR